MPATQNSAFPATCLLSAFFLIAMSSCCLTAMLLSLALYHAGMLCAKQVVSAPEGDRDGQDKSPSPLRGKSSALKGRSGPSRAKSTNAPKLEIAIVGAGDICGEVGI